MVPHLQRSAMGVRRMPIAVLSMVPASRIQIIGGTRTTAESYEGNAWVLTLAQAAPPVAGAIKDGCHAQVAITPHHRALPAAHPPPLPLLLPAAHPPPPLRPIAT